MVCNNFDLLLSNLGFEQRHHSVPVLCSVVSLNVACYLLSTNSSASGDTSTLAIADVNTDHSELRSILTQMTESLFEEDQYSRELRNTSST